MSLPFASVQIEAADDKIRLMISGVDTSSATFLAVRSVKLLNGDVYEYPYVCLVSSQSHAIESWEMYGRWCAIGNFHRVGETFTLTYHGETWLSFELDPAFGHPDVGSCEPKGPYDWTEIGITGEASGQLNAHTFTDCKGRVGRGTHRLAGVFTDQIKEHALPLFWDEVDDTVTAMTHRLSFEYPASNALLLPLLTWRYNSWGWFGSGSPSKSKSKSNLGVANPFSRWNWQHGRMWWVEVPLKMDAIEKVIPPHTTLVGSHGYVFVARYPVWRYNRAHPLASLHPNAHSNGPYREIVLRVLVRYQDTVYQHVITALVDQIRPMMAGRCRLGTPKMLADFDGTIDFDSIQVIALNSDDQTFEMSVSAARSDQPHEGPVPHLDHDDLSIVPLSIGGDHSYLLWSGNNQVGEVNHNAQGCRVKFGERMGTFVENKCTKSGVVDLNWGDDTLGHNWPVHQETIPIDYWENVSTLVWPPSMLANVAGMIRTFRTFLHGAGMPNT